MGSVPLLVNGVGSAFLVVSSEPQEAWPAFFAMEGSSGAPAGNTEYHGLAA